jgi:EmrB/QacA subfamily drug resistance transporter
MTWIKRWAPVLVLSLALAIIIIDTTLLNVSLGTIIREFHTDIQSLQWVITVYALMLAAFTVTGGRLGDIFGRKKMFILGAIIFAAGSFIASISTNIPQLLLGESIIEGVGAALMMPATASLLMSGYSGRTRAIAFGVWGGVAGAASAVGPILGGYLTTHYSWRWGFRINVFVSLALVLGSFIVKEYKSTNRKPTLDWLGVFLSSIGLLSIVFGIIESSTYGWIKAKAPFVVGDMTIDFSWLSIVPVVLVIGLIFLILFLLWEKRVEARGRMPLVSLHLFQNLQFTSGMSTTAVLTLGQTGMIFAIPVYLQGVLGKDAFNTGLALLPLSITLFIAAPLSAVISKTIAPKYLIQFGMLCNTVSLVIMAYSVGPIAATAGLFWGLVLFGLGTGIVMSQGSNLTLSAVAVADAGEASGVNNTFRQIGSALGSAIIGAVLLGTLTTQVGDNIANSSVIPNNLKTKLEQAVASQSSAIEFSGHAQLPGSIPPAIQTEIVNLSHQATATATTQALLYAALFSGLGIIVSVKLPRTFRPNDPSPTPLAD